MSLLDTLKAQQPAILADLEAIVRLEAPSYDLNGLTQVAAWIRGKFTQFGPVETTDTPHGPMLSQRLEGPGPRVLVLCHFDTVHPVGAFGWKLDGNLAYGPGIYDMKGAIVQLWWAMLALKQAGKPWGNLHLLFTPDEEVGSIASRQAIEEAAREAALVFVLEAPMGNGDLKVARKGVGQYQLKAVGKPAHQGVEPEKGINAIVELSHQIGQVVALQDLARGTTLGPNVVKGGTTSNVVAEEAVVHIDMRVWELAEASRVEAGLKALRPLLAGARLELSGGVNRPPMEPTPASTALFEKARELGRTVGLELGAGRVGGGSDGNFTAALGIPTLDGMGLFGADAHQKTERIFVDQVVPRTALLAEMLAWAAQS